MNITNLDKVVKDFLVGDELMNQLQSDKSISIFGSARIKESEEEYKKTMYLAEELANRGINIISGGGPGIMEAANKGAHLSGKAHSIGMGIYLPFEQEDNRFLTHGQQFKYFFSRKVMLMRDSKAFIIMKGGFGTLDEMFEALTLMQTGKLEKRKFYLVGIEYYKPLVDFMYNTMLGGETIKQEDMDLIVLTDDLDFVIEDIEKTLNEK